MGRGRWIMGDVRHTVVAHAKRRVAARPADLGSDDAQMTWYDMLVNLLLQFRCGQKRGGENGGWDPIAERWIWPGCCIGKIRPKWVSNIGSGEYEFPAVFIQPSGKIRRIPKPELK